MKKLTSLLACALLSSACDTKDKTPLPGTRESYLNFSTSILPEEPNKKINVTLPMQTQNTHTTALIGQNPALAAKLAPAWSLQLGEGASSGQRILSAPVVDNGVLYGMDAQGTVVAVQLPESTTTTKDAASIAESQSGKILWQAPTSPAGLGADTLGGGVAVSSGVVFAATSFGEMVAIDAKTGKQKWKKSDFAPFRSAPFVQDNRVFAQSINNELIALDTQTGESLWSHSGISETAQLLMGSMPTGAYDTIIVAYSSGEVHALNTVSGQILWSDTITPVARIDTVTDIPHICARPIVDGNQVFIVSHGGRMTALDLKTGSRQWQKELGGIQTPLVLSQHIFSITNQNELVCLGRDNGSVKWVIKLPATEKGEPQPFYSGPILAGDTLIITASTGQILRLNPSDGSVKETLAIEGSPQLPALVVNKTLLALTDNAVLHAFR